MVQQAIQFATKKHDGQVDRAGAPYIEHPKKVASMVDGDDAKIVALLHDTVEDEGATIDEIRLMFGDKIADAVSVLTRDMSVPYMDYIAKIKGNEIAKAVKIADLKHNMDLSRLPEIKDSDIQRVNKRYKPAYEMLVN